MLSCSEKILHADDIRAASGQPLADAAPLIRYATEADYAAVEALWLEAFPEDTPGDVADFWHRYYTPTRVWLYAVESEVCAMLSVFPVRWENTPAAYVYALATDSRYRGRGIARKLLTYVGQQLQRAIIVHPEHNGVEAFYRKIGFSVLPEERLRAMAKANGIEELLMDSGDGYVKEFEA